MVRTMHPAYGRICFLLLFILPILFSITCGEKLILNCKVIEYSTPPPHLWPVNGNEELICIRGYNGISIWAIWSEVELVATAKEGQVIKFIKGRSCKEVNEKYSNKSSWIPSFSSFFSSNTGGGKTSVMVSPYGENCFAVYTDTPTVPLPTFSLRVIVYKVRLLYPVMMIAGMLIFYNADDISRNVLFYYTSGVSVGMILALFLVIFIMSRLIPQRGVGYAFLIGGSSFVLYVLQYIKNQFTSEAIEGNKIIYCYFVFAGLISFLYCYYRGPVKSERGYDILRWCLQSFALFLVYYGIRCEQISLTFVIILVATRWIALQAIFSYIVTRRWIPYRLQAFFIKPRLLTLEEYEREGREETARALKELREYCESPNCSTWKTVSRLKSPKRFASFISDGVHITEDEQQDYDEPSFDATPFMTSDEDSEIDLAETNLDFTE